MKQWCFESLGGRKGRQRRTSGSHNDDWSNGSRRRSWSAETAAVGVGDGVGWGKENVHWEIGSLAARMPLRRWMFSVWGVAGYGHSGAGLGQHPQRWRSRRWRQTAGVGAEEHPLAGAVGTGAAAAGSATGGLGAGSAQSATLGGRMWTHWGRRWWRKPT